MRSTFGRALIAISAGELGAQALAVDAERLKRQTFVLSAVFAGVAGSVYASQQSYIDPGSFSFLLSVNFVLMSVIGGLRSLWGAVIGAAIVVVLGQLLQAYVPVIPAERARRLPAVLPRRDPDRDAHPAAARHHQPLQRGARRMMASLWQYVLAGVVVGAIYALIAAGFVLIYQVTGLINFAQGEFAMIGAMTAASLATNGMRPLEAAAIAVAVAAVAGAVCYLLAIRPARAATGVTLIFITLGLDVALRGLGLFVWGTNPLSLDAFSAGAAITVFGGVLPPQALWVLLTDVVVFGALYLFFRHTYAGTAVRAAVANPPIASTFGIPLRTFAFWSFVAAAAIGGLGGVVVAPITSATYDMGLTLGLAGFVAAVLGGLDSLPGALVGGFVLGIVEKVAGGLLSTGWEEGVGFLILVLVLVLRPQGLLGRAVRRA